jgi:hypothetical protein
MSDVVEKNSSIKAYATGVGPCSDGANHSSRVEIWEQVFSRPIQPAIFAVVGLIVALQLGNGILGGERLPEKLKVFELPTAT